MVKDIIVKTVGGQEVATVIGLVQGPVITETFRAKNEDPVVAQLMVFNDRQGLKGLPKPDTVGNDAAAKTVEFVDGADYTVTLKFIKFFPNYGVADTGS